MKLLLKLLVWGTAMLLLAAVVSVVAAFVYHNGAWVRIELPVTGSGVERPISWYPLELHLGGALVGVFFAGAFGVLLLVLIPLALRRGYERRRQRRFISGLEGELTELRNLPFTSPAPFEDLEDLPGPSGEPPSSEARSSVGALGKRKSSWRALDDDALMVAALQDRPSDLDAARLSKQAHPSGAGRETEPSR